MLAKLVHIVRWSYNLMLAKLVHIVRWSQSRYWISLLPFRTTVAIATAPAAQELSQLSLLVLQHTSDGTAGSQGYGTVLASQSHTTNQGRAMHI